ncbi:hypothetical protein JW698_02455 [Candidatus Wolfebacteria bacterium]|nr:hypothetical protein [Candidatus Wolfebacteria bacterium]
MNKKNTEIKLKSKSEIEWRAPEFEYYKKDVSWYWLSLIIVIILMALAIWQKNFLFIIFIIIAWLTIITMSYRLPTIWNFKIDDNGIKIELPKEKGVEKIYSFKEIKGFDIHDIQEEKFLNEQDIKILSKQIIKQNKFKKLILKLESKFSPYLKINIPINKEKEIEELLKNFLPKEEYEESLADSLSKLIKF